MPNMTDTADFLANVTVQAAPMTVAQFMAYMATFVYAASRK